MTSPDLVRRSKFLSLVLRHRPDEIGLHLDASGWADVACAARVGVRLNEPLLRQIVEESDKQRFALSADGRRIRANQGHSIDVDLGLPSVTPPEELFNRTATRFVESIRQQGLEAGQRQHVHLSPDERTAQAVGRRHGKPVVLRIRAGAMFHDGSRFYLSENGVWLTNHVPPAYLRFPHVRVPQIRCAPWYASPAGV